MIQNIKHIIMTAALLVSISQLCTAGEIKISSTNGTVTSSVNGTTVTLTATPDKGYYITVDNFTVEKTVNGAQAGTAKRTPGVSDHLTVTASNPSADPSGVTTYTFTLPEGYDAEVTANFQQRTSIADATISLESTEVTYTGKELEPAIKSVVIGQELELSSDDYTVVYTNNINVGTATVTLTGIKTFTGTKTTTFEITKATPTLVFPQDSYVTYMDSTFSAPKVTTEPTGIKVKYTSSNESVATVDAETGEVTTKSIGETIIKATTDDNNSVESSTSYTLTVKEAQGYRIYVNNILITEENKNDVLNDADKEKRRAGSVIYGSKNNCLGLTNAKDINIVCNRTDTLKIYLRNNNHATSITSNSNCKLLFTTDGGYPGDLKLKKDKGPVVSGFSDVKYECNLELLDGKLDGDSATIGVYLPPIVDPVKEPTPVGDLAGAEGEGGDQGTIKVIVNSIMYTFTPAGDNGADLASGQFIINTPTDIEKIIDKIKNISINSPDFAEGLNGITFRVSAGQYTVELEAISYGENELMAYIQGGNPFRINLPEGQQIKKKFTIMVTEPAIVTIFAVAKAQSAKANHRIGRKTTATVATSSIIIKPEKLNSSNPINSVIEDYPAETLNEEAQKADNDTKITEINVITEEKPYSGIAEYTILRVQPSTFYDLQGRRITNPTKAGIYITQGKKVVIK